MFFIYKTRQKKGCRRAGKRSEGTKKEGGACAISSHTQWRKSERAGGLNVRRGTAARSFQTMNVVWSERFCTGKACGYRFMDTCRGGASTAQYHQMAVSLTGGAQWRRIAVPAMGSQRRGAAKAAACNGAAAYRGIGIRQSARTHFGDFAAAANRAGWEHEKGAGRGIRRGKREEGSMEREMCFS